MSQINDRNGLRFSCFSCNYIRRLVDINVEKCIYMDEWCFVWAAEGEFADLMYLIGVNICITEKSLSIYGQEKMRFRDG